VLTPLAAGVAVGGGVAIAPATGDAWGAERARVARSNAKRGMRENMS
jgi:hypothetical protein